MDIPRTPIGDGVRPGVGVDGAQDTSLPYMDLETALIAVEMQRTQRLDTQLLAMVNDVQMRNEKIDKLNSAMSELQKLLNKFAADAKPGDKVPGDNSDTIDAANGAIRDAGLSGDIFSSGSIVSKDTTKADLEAAATKLRGLIDGLGNTQQVVMLRLQGAMGKRNEAFDLMTNTVKKLQDSRSAIVSNMR